MKHCIYLEGNLRLEKVMQYSENIVLNKMHHIA